jgi:hypothetical protein
LCPRRRFPLTCFFSGTGSDHRLLARRGDVTHTQDHQNADGALLAKRKPVFEGR